MLADKPEDRARWEKEIDLREREVAAKEKEADKGTGDKPSFPIPEFLDVDFTVFDGGSNDDEASQGD